MSNIEKCKTINRISTIGLAMTINDEKEQTYEEWLKSLEIGTYIVFDAQKYGSEKKYVIDKVKSITPSGKIRLASGLLFDKNGDHKVDNYQTYHLEKYTIQIHNELENKRILEKIQKTNFKLLTSEQLQAIYEIIK